MKFVTFKAGGEAKPGVLTGDLTGIVDLSPAYPDLLSLIRAGEAGLAKAAAMLEAGAPIVGMADATLLAPLPNPTRLRDCSVFEEHILGGARWAEKAGIPELAKVPDIWYKEPIFYKGNHLGMAGPDELIEWPEGCQKFDYELEIAIVIGKPGKNIARDQAHDHIFGLTIYNDLSQRDASMEMSGRMGPAKAKDSDQCNIIGPWIATPDEFEDIYALGMTASINGQKMGGGNTRDMYHKWDKIIAYCSSRSETLHSGEIIGSGTVGGGTLMEFGRFIEPGDTVEMAIDGLGVLRNQIGRKA